MNVILGAAVAVSGYVIWMACRRPPRRTDWRERILYLHPTGGQTLTALMKKLDEAPTDDPTFAWFEGKMGRP
jgi:hypothetical protein